MSHSETYDIEPYALLRIALAAFEKTPQELSSDELAQIAVQARNEQDLECRVLSSPEAAGVIVSDQELENAVKAISDRFEDEESFLNELKKNGLTPDLLASALSRQCKVENILESVASRANKISEVEIGVYYHMHPEKFVIPERRTVRHILITINDDYAENTRENALLRIQDIGEKLRRKPYKFSELAMQHSECPTALQGGELGAYPKGHLYPEIDAVLFHMKTEQLSDVIETEAGFHLILCEKIQYGETMSLKKATPKILQLMEGRSRLACQRSWLASLPKVTKIDSK
ncbi:nitrogen fixation protein NifM [Methyloprofundus sedimenti]|uniref:peptidylprolyl isomerase n=1 Tax=Methyloprofundus sedimenti TaxID=1420851 RepID=A0A1V8M287_9GAMM|nr:nitrogen fixation protein NifM [Methyloprofundus sedimenti]OQK15543.1 nitrogen fixation protein NifM [Methyloprofundus sedimenti]